jgi:hypothetical protein
MNDVFGTRIFQRKKKTDIKLNKVRTAIRARILIKARKKYFRNANTDEFN